jgi:hypothetical protein
MSLGDLGLMCEQAVRYSTKIPIYNVAVLIVFIIKPLGPILETISCRYTLVRWVTHIRLFVHHPSAQTSKESEASYFES